MTNSPPLISIIMPCYNEERYIYGSIKSLVTDNFNETKELIVVDGKSRDWTRGIIQHFIDQGLHISIIENDKKIQAFGLNLGISQAKGKYIVRADAHGVYPPDYVENCVQLLEETGAANVGGIMLPRGENTKQKAIALAFQHPVGVGDAKWRAGNYTGNVDTVYLGTFKRSLFEKIGMYDSNCITAEDAELNFRLLKAGKKIYQDSSIKVTCFPRKTLLALARQYLRYGKGRCYLVLKHRKITSLRQAAPVALDVTILASLLLSIWFPIFLFYPLLYILSLFAASFLTWRKRKISINLRFLMAAAWAVMHLSWGAGFLFYLAFEKKPAHHKRIEKS